MSGMPKKSSDLVNSFGIVLIGITSAILLWVSVVALQAYYAATAGEVEQQRLEADQGREVRELKATQQAALHEWKWVDQKKRTVTLSIEHAMALVVRDAAAGAGSLVPAIVDPAAPKYVPTIPAEPGHPADDAALPAAPAGAAPVPAPAAPAAAGGGN